MTRSISDAIYLKKQILMETPFSVSETEKHLLLAKTSRFFGLGLYWGEGNQSKISILVRLGNTDPSLLAVFL